MDKEKTKGEKIKMATSTTKPKQTSGCRLSHPKSGDEVLISGISGYFPDSNSVMQLQENLFNKVDLISENHRRWNLEYQNIPRSGKINNINKFDASFFGVNFREAHTMNPIGRMLLEKTYEAIVDAGVNPKELRNTKTGVFMGSGICESEKTWLYDRINVNNFGIIGCSKSMLANRISSWLGVTGPSYTVDTACSSSFYAVEHAYKAIREGRCDAAIVGGSNLCLHPCISLQHLNLGILSPKGKCRSFDNKADGYVRSEAVVVIFLQKAKDSRRVYAQVLHIKTNCDGFNEEGISYPSGHSQKILFDELYEECSIPPNSVEFIEAHGTGTRVGDLEEIKAMDAVFCRDRSEPLMIGSVKSNCGHSEAASGLCSVAKVCIAYTTGYIPPNLNYDTPREDIPALVEGRVKVITEKTPWNRGLCGITNLGFGGTNAHLLLKNFAKQKINNGMPSDNLPRLVCASGRKELAVAKIFDYLESKTIDAEFIRLLHAIHDEDISGHTFRGYTLLGSTPTKCMPLARNIQSFSGVRRPVCFVYSDMGSQWAGMAKQLMRIPIFAGAIEKCHKLLEPKGISLTNIITEPKPKIYSNILNSFIGIAAVQIGLTDFLKAVGIEPDFIIGHGFGELGRAYADTSITAGQMILSAYDYGSSTFKTPYIKGSMVPVELGNNGSLSFEEKSRSIPANAVIIEITAQSLLDNILCNPLKKDIIYIPLFDNNHEDNVQVLFTALGKLYEAGLNPHLANIYPHVQFPVSQGTSMISHLVEWEHSENWYVALYDGKEEKNAGERIVRVTLSDEDYEYLAGHVIDGCNIYPGTGYLVMAWETLAMMLGKIYTEVAVVFEEVHFQRTINIPENGNLEFIIMIQKNSGYFDIVESGVSVVTGRIYAQQNVGQDYQEHSVAPEVTDPNVKPMLTKDIYKELHLRGYQYSGIFRSIIDCNVEGTRGRLGWHNNWIVFINCMLQMRIISMDTRSLVMPTRIQKIAIDPHIHYGSISENNSDCADISFEIRVYPDFDVIRSGGVEIEGLHTTSIFKKVLSDNPVLEKCVFIPNIGKTIMKVEDIFRAYLQLIFENVQAYKMQGIELADAEYKKNHLESVMEIISNILTNMSTIQIELSVISKIPLESSSYNTIGKKIVRESNPTIFIGACLLKRPKVIEQALSIFGDKCFVISREKENINPKDYYHKYDVVNIQATDLEHLVLFRKKVQPKPAKFVKINTADQSYGWIDPIKAEIKSGRKLVIYSQNEQINGLLGFINCLRKEPGSEAVHGFLIFDPFAPSFKADLEFYKEQLDKDLAINIYKDGQWGTYRHLLLDDLKTVDADHAFANISTIGDLSSLRWFEGPIREDQQFKSLDSVFIYVYYSALNFSDVMTAVGRVPLDAIAHGRLAQECTQGCEVVGRTNNGTRVMAMVRNSGITNMVEGHRLLMWGIPDEWTFEEAATVPVAYGIVYYSMIMIGKLQYGDSILIHAGSGGVGQAAINVALHFGCVIFTTVGSPEKRAFIKKIFPQLKDSHIGNSRDTSFEDMIRKETDGKGVDMVLNSLSDEKLQASMRCLSNQGRFLEIGKYDIINNTAIKLHRYRKEISFHSVMLDSIYNLNPELVQTLQELLTSGIVSGAVRPLTYCTFEQTELESAYRYMAAGKHIGKVIIKIRDEEPSNCSVELKPCKIKAIPRYTCTAESVYVVVGGLGGFGLELTDWLIIRGARKVVLASRHGIRNGYQSSRVRVWSDYGVDIHISTFDVTTEAGCEELLKKANSMGLVVAIFNLAMVLDDRIFQNQSSESFKTVFAPKAQVTMNLDKLSRKLCPKLKDFVIFSSVSSGRGNMGQTNYGFANSVMERICEWRKKLGLPALAIQWGPVDDVGSFADMKEEYVNLDIHGFVPQRISSCLSSLNKFLKQDAVIVSSHRVAEKKFVVSESCSTVDVIAQVMGIKDVKAVSQKASLADLGMDSMMALEIQQTLDREFKIFLTSDAIRALTFARLAELTAQSRR